MAVAVVAVAATAAVVDVTNLTGMDDRKVVSHFMTLILQKWEIYAKLFQ